MAKKRRQSDEKGMPADSGDNCAAAAPLDPHLVIIARAIGRLIATAENYPELKANNNFMQLQSRITELESEIADRREFYNDSVNTFNTRLQEMPDAILARNMGLAPRGMYQVAEEDKAPVKIAFADVSH